MISLPEFNEQMDDKGWVIFPDFVHESLVNRMIDDLESAYITCREIQLKNGLGNTEGTTHHLIGQGQSFLDYLELFSELNDYAESYFGGKYILNAFGGNLLKSGMSYASDIHRDIRSYSAQLPLMLNTIVMLDDFTAGNGATWLMNGGHDWEEKPAESEFKRYAFQVTGKAGSVVFFNSNMWHKAGDNRTEKPRRSVTPMFTRPFFKPQFDYPRVLGYHMGSSHSDYVRQILGYNSRTPKSLDEWYKPKEQRFYRGDQG